MLSEGFRDVMEIDCQGNFQTDARDRTAQRQLLLAINDNVFRRFEGFTEALGKNSHQNQAQPDDDKLVIKLTRAEKHELISQLFEARRATEE